MYIFFPISRFILILCMIMGSKLMKHCISQELNLSPAEIFTYICFIQEKFSNSLIDGRHLLTLRNS